MEPTPTRMPICDFVIMKPPTEQEIAEITPKLDYVKKVTLAGWKRSHDRANKLLGSKDIEHVIGRSKSPRKSANFKKP